MPASKPSAVSKRVAQVIDREEGGVVSEAARRLGLSQRGLQKIYRGLTQHPGANILEAIVRKYGVDATWLLTGVTSAEYLQSEEALEIRSRRRCSELMLGFAKILRAGDPDVVTEELLEVTRVGSYEVRGVAHELAALLSRHSRAG